MQLFKHKDMKTMKMLALAVALAMACAHAIGAEFEKKVFQSAEGLNLPYRALAPEHIVKGEKYPLVLFLHGAGERGTDNEAQLTHGGQMWLNPVNREKYPAFVVVPQCPDGVYWSYIGRPETLYPDSMPANPPESAVGNAVMQLVEQYRNNPQVDTDRIYIMGLSMGGIATYDLTVRHPEVFAAAIPICGSVNPSRMKANGVSYRIYHGDADNVVPVEGSRCAYEALKSAGANATYIEFPGVAHGSWNPAFNDADFLPWLFSQSRHGNKRNASSAHKIAVLSDVHVTPGNQNEEQLRIAVEEINNGDFDIVVMNGDLSNEGSDVELANVKSILDGIRHPLYVLPGNHENNWSQSATKTFVDLWGNDRFVTTVDSLVVIGINCGPYMKMGDGHVKQEDLHWLRHTLDSIVNPGMKVLSFNHYPIQKDDLDNYIEYAQTLEKYPVIAHINGHYHTWKHYNAGDIECVMTRALKMDRGNFGYAIIEIDKDWAHIYEKELGKDKKAKYAFAVKNQLKPIEVPETAKFEKPEGFTIEKVWADSASIFTRLAFDNDNVYFGTSLGTAKAINKQSKATSWQLPLGASLFSRPVVLQKGNVAIPNATGITVVNGTTGKVVKEWKSDEGPYVADGLLADGKYIQGGYKRIERRNPATGKLVWKYDSIFNYCQAAPVVDGKDLIFGAWDTNLRCLNVDNGKLRWVWNNGNAANMLGPGNVVPVVTSDKVIIVAPDRFMTALDRSTGKQLWRDKSHRYRESLGKSADGKVAYAKTMDGELVAVDATSDTFRELWTVDMGLGYEHAPCIIAEKDGVVYAGSRRGILTAVDPIEKKVIWQLPLGVSEINGIDIDPTDDSVWVSLIEGTIFRIAKDY